MHKLIMLALTIFTFADLNAQTSKVGYVDFETIYKQLPDVRIVQEQIEVDKLKRQQELDLKMNVVKQKTNALYAVSYHEIARDTANNRRDNLAATNQSLRNTLEAEARSALEQYNAYSKASLEAIEQKENQLQSQITEKIKLAIRSVVTEKGYSNVLPLREALYYSPTDDLTKAVMLKLGIASF